MFPVPAHLPRTGGEHLASQSGVSSSSEGVQIRDDHQVSDPVLDLFEPLLQQKELKSETIRALKEKLEQATKSNKGITHELLKSNYPSISSHIRSAAQITADFTSVQSRLTDLEGQIDPNNQETSFIPPVLTLLQRHFTAVRAQTKSQAHVKALRDLKNRVKELEKLENAVYEARGADEDVIESVLSSAADEDEGGALRRSRVMKAILSRRELLRSMIIEQVTDGFRQAISVGESPGSPVVLSVQHHTSLQRPRNPHPGHTASTSTSKTPAYSLGQLYSPLARLDALDSPLRQLQTQLIEKLVEPLLRGGTTLQREDDDSSATLRLAISSERSPAEILSDLSSTCEFVKHVVFPESPQPEISDTRSRFLGELHESTSRLILEQLILPRTPSGLSDLRPWLETVQSAVDFESQSATAGTRPIKVFYDETAGSTWANGRRRKLAEEVRKLILSGWQSWEAVKISRDKEISVVIEVEVEEEDEPMPIASGSEEAAKLPLGEDASKSVDSADDAQEEEGWGFDETAESKQPTAGPSSPTRNGSVVDEVEDGWAFDDDLSAPAPKPVPIVAPKPTREAKKLGRKVAKSRQVDHDDEDDQGTDLSRTSSIQPPTPPVASPTPPPPQSEAMDWEAWDDEKPSKREEVKPKAKRKELREEKRTIKETFLVSKACETLLDLAQNALRDSQDLSSDLPAPSFSLAPTILHTTANEIFDLYRALITSHFASQLQNVPTLSMQVYNDSIHLSDRIQSISSEYSGWPSTDTQRRLQESGEACFERELERQRNSLVTTLDGIEWSKGVEALKRSQGVLQQVRNDLEDLSRMFQPVLPTTTYLVVIGYLVNVAITHVTDAILSQQDITEDESVQLTELLKMLHPLEELFVLEPGQPSSVVEHVHGWLKFCYLLELLSANLVDITYLFENGALIDFTPDELIGLLKALFADSEKREKAIERIERGL